MTKWEWWVRSFAGVSCVTSVLVAVAGEGGWWTAGRLALAAAWAVVAVVGSPKLAPYVGLVWIFIFAYNGARWAHTTVVTDSWWALGFLLFWALSGTVVLTIAAVSTALHRESRRLDAAAARRQVWERGTYEW